MPLSFKLYYACAMYLLLWGSGFFMWMFYESALHGMGSETGMVLTFFLIVALAIVSGFMGIRAVKRYKEGMMLSKTERVVFIACYVFIVLFALGMALVLGLLIIPEEINRRNYNGYMRRVNIEDLVLTSSLLLAALAAIYYAITGLFLLKAIRFKHRDTLMSFEIGQP